MPNVVAALPNIGGASVQRRKVWLTPTTRVPCQDAKPDDISWRYPKLANRSQPLVAEFHHVMRTCGGDIAV